MQSNEYTACNLINLLQTKAPTWPMMCGEQFLAKIGCHPLALARFDSLIKSSPQSQRPDLSALLTQTIKGDISQFVRQCRWVA